MKNIIFIFVIILITQVSFSQWIQQQTGITQNLNDICFINETTGIAVGSNGTMVRTTNGGINWYTVTVPTTQSFYSTCFPTIQIGYASGYTGFVITTSNGGSSWYNNTSCGINVRSISFINMNTGITGGGGNLMCHTTNGGIAYSQRYTPTAHAVTGVHYVNSSLLMVCASDMPGAVIHKSTNTGNNFSTVLTMNNSGLNTTYYLNSIYFKDGNTGFATGSYTSLGANYGTIYRSTNAGDNWGAATTFGPDSGMSINSIHFGDSLNGFVVGNKGKILRTINGGLNWVTQVSGVNTSLNGIYMCNALTGYICGSGGTILKTTNGGVMGITPINNEIPEKYKLEQNYPNPFNPLTNIRFLIKDSKFTSLKIFDILGKEIATLVNEKLSPGTYEVQWNTLMLSSGIYLYKIQAGEYSEIKKMMLIK